MIDLIRDILDKQLVDREGVKIGKVDGIIAELRPNVPPKVMAIEIGAITLASRLGSGPARWTTWLAAKIGGERHNAPHRIPWEKVRDIGIDIEVDLDVRETAIFDWQDWLRERVIGRIPGA